MFTIELKNRFESSAMETQEVKATSTASTSVVAAPAGKKQGFTEKLLSLLGKEMFLQLWACCQEPISLPGREAELQQLTVTRKTFHKRVFEGDITLKDGSIHHVGDSRKAIKDAKKWQNEMVYGKAKALFEYEKKPLLKAISKFHKEEALQHCWRWEYKDCYSLCMGYRSDFLRKAEAAKGVDKKVYYLLAKAMEDRDYIQALYNGINSAVDKAIKSEI